MFLHNPPTDLPSVDSSANSTAKTSANFVPLRRLESRQLPSYLYEYDCNVVPQINIVSSINTKSPYSLSKVFTYSRLSN